jgi:hypothetical protein
MQQMLRWFKTVRVQRGERMPSRYGAVYLDLCRLEAVCAHIPLNVIYRAAHLTRLFFIAPWFAGPWERRVKELRQREEILHRHKLWIGPDCRVFRVQQ